MRAGKIAAFTVAGGQGTRLGYDGPKGTLAVSPINGKPLFQLFAEQILGMSEKHGAVIPWYVMCSPLNLEATVSHFTKRKFYGLGQNNLKFFAQGVMPATDFDGNLLLATEDSLALSPNGHGGSLKALIDSGSIADMETRGIEHALILSSGQSIGQSHQSLFHRTARLEEIGYVQSLHHQNRPL